MIEAILGLFFNMCCNQLLRANNASHCKSGFTIANDSVRRSRLQEVAVVVVVVVVVVVA